MSRRASGPGGGLPAVNLLPDSEFDRIAARRLRHRFGAAVLVLVALAGAAWWVQHSRVDDARQLLSVEEAETTRVNAQTRKLAPVRAFVTGVEAQRRTVEQAMVVEIYFSEVLDGIRDSAPAGARMDSIAVSVGSTDGEPGTSACPGPDPFATRLVIGCVTLAGTAQSRTQVGEMVIALGKSSLFVEPFISTTTTDDSAEVAFSGSVGLSPAVFSGRYLPADLPTLDEIEDGAKTLAKDQP